MRGTRSVRRPADGTIRRDVSRTARDAAATTSPEDAAGRTKADEVDLRSDLQAARREVDLVREESCRRAEVEQAKGILIARYHCSPVAAGGHPVAVGRHDLDGRRPGRRGRRPITRGLPLQADRRGTGAVRRGNLARLHMELFAPR